MSALLVVSAALNAWVLLTWLFRDGPGVFEGDWITVTDLLSRHPRHGERALTHDSIYLEYR